MLRSVVGWVRVQDENWQATMHRMKIRIQRAANLHFVAPSEFRVRRDQWRYALHLANSRVKWLALVTQWQPLQCVDRFAPFVPSRGCGRPRKRWDDEVNAFSRLVFGARHWITEFQQYDSRVYIDLCDAYVAYCNL